MALMLSTFVVGFLASLYLMYSTYWVEHIIYESLICYQERGQKQTCLNEAKQKIHSVLFFKKYFDMKIIDKGSKTEALLTMKISPPFLDPKEIKFSRVLEI